VFINLRVNPFWEIRFIQRVVAQMSVVSMGVAWFQFHSQFWFHFLKLKLTVLASSRIASPTSPVVLEGSEELSQEPSQELIRRLTVTTNNG
jgi:hypothetical protein